MRDLIKLAWRNIWRNKRRTIITIASVFFALFLSLTMRSMQLGTYSHWIKGVVENFSGHIQVQRQGYQDDKSIDNTYEITDSLMKAISLNEHVKAVVPRLESFALISYKVQTKGIFVLGIHPEKETDLIDPKGKLIKGTYFSEEGNEVLLSNRLANYLKADIGDTITLLGQGYHGATAAGIYAVTGIVELPNPDFDKHTVFMPLKKAQYFYGAYNRVTSTAVSVDRDDKLQAIAEALSTTVGSEYEVLTWKDLNPEMVQQIESDQYSGYLMLGLLYTIVGFGILGTLLMMISERRREFGILVAIGMKKTRLTLMVFFEVISLCGIGVVAGILANIPLILYMQYNPPRFEGEMEEIMISYGMEPVMPFALEPGFFLGQTGIVLLLFGLSMIYPLVTLIKLKPVKALRT